MKRNIKTPPLHCSAGSALRAGRGSVFSGFRRIPRGIWTASSVDELGVAYDALGRSGWYSNLDVTCKRVLEHLNSGNILVDYSGGTGLLVDRLAKDLRAKRAGAIIVDSSPKFLRVALEKHRENPCVAFRLLKMIRGAGRLQTLEKALGGRIAEEGVNVIVSANAVHLYRDLESVLFQWRRCLRSNGVVLANSGNITHWPRQQGLWTIDDTVRAVRRAAMDIVTSDPRFKMYRATVGDKSRMHSYELYFDQVFPKARAIDHYINAFKSTGYGAAKFDIDVLTIDVDEWLEFLGVYKDAILGWVGGLRRIDGVEPAAVAVRDRKCLLQEALDAVMVNSRTFRAIWTHMECS